MDKKLKITIPAEKCRELMRQNFVFHSLSATKMQYFDGISFAIAIFCGNALCYECTFESEEAMSMFQMKYL